MNGEISEKRWADLTDDQKLWIIYDTMRVRHERYTAHFRRLYLCIGILFLVALSVNPPAWALKLIGLP